MVMPLETLLTRDTQAVASLSMAPWTRDVGQMVVSPGDLYRILERPVWQMHDMDGLTRFGDRDDDYRLPALGADRRWPDFVLDDARALRSGSGNVDWKRTSLAAGAFVLGAATLDKRAHRVAERHRNSEAVKDGIRAGDALPFAALGVSALFAFDESRPYLSNAGVAALEGGALAFVASTGLKYAVGRARPSSNAGISDFDPASTKDRWHSFPSRHTAVMWAAVTPYAEQYGMPWLYGVAALTNASRTAGREHWLSDTVGGAALGYAMGQLAWQARRESARSRNAPVIGVVPGGVSVAWALD
jgi:membrane-associated phospholipid phosphatase